MATTISRFCRSRDSGSADGVRRAGLSVVCAFGLIPEVERSETEITIDPLRTRYLTLTTRAEDEGRKLAAASGGIYYPIKRLEDLQKAYDDVVAQLRSAYTITCASNSVSSSPRVPCERIAMVRQCG